MPAADVAKDDVAEVLFTSGTTAEPKGVLITHRNILANIVPVEGETVNSQLARRVFSRLFQEYGLPKMISTDSGVPFATTALGRLSSLSVWWIRLGIVPELIAPAHPQQNGSHERMHRTLKRETIRPPRGSLAAQQVSFNRFRTEYNEERPHRALGRLPPRRFAERQRTLENSSYQLST